MKTYLSALIFAVLTLLSFNVSATVLYVNLNCTNPVSPYADWSTAATNIQDAVDAATNGDLILVTNGVYQTGGAITKTNFFFPPEFNRVAATKPVAIASINGVAETVIEGGAGNSFRCVFLTNGASLSGFTLRDGVMALTWGGEVFCYSNAAVFNCVISNNYAARGGGAYGGTLSNCILAHNSATHGGGAASNVLINCLIMGNSVSGQGGDGGGAIQSTLNNCVISGNSATGILAAGGGTSGGTLNNCLGQGNLAVQGGGSANCTLNNCLFIANAAGTGGGVFDSTLNNCTIVGNSATNSGGGAGTTLSYTTTS